MVESITRASDVWATLEKMYSGARSVMIMIEVEEKIDALKQGDKSMLQYAAELRALWADLDHYDALTLSCPMDVTQGKAYIERRRVIKFLKDLNPQFENRCAAICHQKKLPSLEEVVAAMEEEEIRQKVMLGDSAPPVRSALAVPDGPKVNDRECYNCRQKGHISYACPHPRNPATGRGIGRGQRGGRRGRGGRGYYEGRVVANMVVAEDGQTDTDGNQQTQQAEVIHELEELRKFKKQIEQTQLKNSGCGSGSTTETFGTFAGYAHAIAGKGDWNQTWDWDKA